ncbi:MAG: J domain-containing protein [Clostridia bacterium]|nr:J domain-containing protein [Clostridia bacterium]
MAQAPWEILNISPDASSSEIKRAYSKLAKQSNPEDDPEAFQKIHDAYKNMITISRLREENKNVVVVQPDGKRILLEPINSDKKDDSDNKPQNTDSESNQVDDDSITAVEVDNIESNNIEADNAEAHEEDTSSFDFSFIQSEDFIETGLDPYAYFNNLCAQIKSKNPGLPFTDEEIIDIALKYLSYINSDSGFSKSKLIWEQYKHNKLVVDAFTLPQFQDEANKHKLSYKDANSICMCVGGKSRAVFDKDKNSYSVSLDFTSKYYIDTFMTRAHRVDNTSSKKNVENESEEQTEPSKKAIDLPKTYFNKILNDRKLNDFRYDCPDMYTPFEFASQTALLIEAAIDYLNYIVTNTDFCNEEVYYQEFGNNKIIRYLNKYDALIGKINARGFADEIVNLIAAGIGGNIKVVKSYNIVNKIVSVIIRLNCNEVPERKPKTIKPKIRTIRTDFDDKVFELLNEAEESKRSDILTNSVLKYINKLVNMNVPINGAEWNDFFNDKYVREVYDMQKFRDTLSQQHFDYNVALRLSVFYNHCGTVHSNNPFRLKNKTYSPRFSKSQNKCECYIGYKNITVNNPDYLKKKKRLNLITTILFIITLILLAISVLLNF